MRSCATASRAILLAAAAGVGMSATAALAVDRNWSDGDGNWSLAGNWTPAGVPNTAADNATIANGSSVQLDNSYSIGSFTLGTGNSLTIQNGRSLTLANDLTNSGLITVDAAGSSTSLNFGTGPHAISGTGQIVLARTGLGNSNALLGGSGTPVLTFGSGQVVRGEGNVGNGTLVITNNGTFSADVAGRTLTLDPDNVAATSFTNNGTLRAQNGGLLLLSGSGDGRFDNTLGTITAQAGSTVQLGVNADVTGGTLSTAGTGSLLFTGAAIRGLTLDGNATLSNGTSLLADGMINHTGTLTIAADGSFTTLSLTNTTFTGTGTVVLARTGLANSNAVVGGIGTPVLTNGALHTFAGEGNIGGGGVAINNSGLMTANVSGRTLTIDPDNVAGVSFTNTGTLRAESGGMLTLTGSGDGRFDNTGGTITSATGGSINLVTGANVTGGNLGGTVSVSGATLHELTSTAAVTVNNGNSLTAGGNIVNNGTITVDADGSFTSLSIANETLNLTGSGTVVLARTGLGNSNAVVGGIGAPVLTNGALHTFAGEGNIGGGVVAINNSGLMTANVSGRTLTIDPDNVAGVSFTNTGTLRAESGGMLTLTGSGDGRFDNTGGTITSATGGSINLVTGANVAGGSLGGTVSVSGATLHDLTSTAAVTVNNGTTLTAGGNIVNNGTITFAADGSFTSLSIANETLNLTGSGTVVLARTGLANSNAVVGGIGNPTLNVGPGQTVQGEGNVGSGTVVVNNGGTIDANVPGRTLTIDPDNVIATTFTNTGTLRASNGGTLSLSGSGDGRFDNTGGVIEAASGSTVNRVASATITNFTASGNVINGGGYRTINGTLNVAPTGFDVATSNAAITLSGTTAQTDLFAETNTATNPAFNPAPGQLVSANFGTNNGTLVVADGARLLTRAGTPAFSTATGVQVATFTNNGTLRVATGGTFAVSSDSNSGSPFPGNINSTAGSIIGGEGTLNAAVTNAGQLNVADLGTTGQLTVASLTLTPTSIVKLDLAASGTGASDLINILQNLNLGGTLDVNVLAPFTATDGELFQIVDGGAGIGAFGPVSGDFAAITDNSAIYNFQSVINTATGDVFLRAVAVPEPAGLALIGLPAAALLRRRRRSVESGLI